MLYKGGSSTMGTSVPGGEYLVNFFLSSQVAAAARYALRHNPSAFDQYFSADDLVKFCKDNKIHSDPSKKDIVVDGNLKGLVAKVQSFDPKKEDVFYDVKFPYVSRSGERNILGKDYSCNCPEGQGKGREINLDICRHMAYAMIFSAEKLGGEDFGVFGYENSEVLKGIATIIKKSVNEKVKLKDMHLEMPERKKVFKKLLRDNLDFSGVDLKLVD